MHFSRNQIEQLNRFLTHRKIFDASSFEEFIDWNEFWWISLMFQPLIGLFIIHIPSTDHFAFFSQWQSSEQWIILNDFRHEINLLSKIVQIILFLFLNIESHADCPIVRCAVRLSVWLKLIYKLVMCHLFTVHLSVFKYIWRLVRCSANEVPVVCQRNELNGGRHENG